MGEPEPPLDRNDQPAADIAAKCELLSLADRELDDWLRALDARP